jgi:hypothetical protein
MKWSIEKAQLWMNTENPHLGNSTPDHLVMMGRSHKLMSFIENAIDENGDPTP